MQTKCLVYRIALTTASLVAILTSSLTFPSAKVEARPCGRDILSKIGCQLDPTNPLDPNRNIFEEDPPPAPPVERRFTICNKTSVGNVYVAIALNYTGSDGEGAWPHFESHGWWNIEPGACKKVYANSANRVRGYYVKSEDEDSVWSGSGSDKSYCINPSVEFEFKGSSTYSEGECQETGGQMVIFKPVRPNGQAYTLTLTD